MHDHITRDTLTRERKAGQRVEDEIMRKLAALGVTERTRARDVLAALDTLTAPAWCDTDAWQYMCEHARCWARAHGSLEVWAGLRRLKDKQVEPWLRGRRGERVSREELEAFEVAE